MPRFLALEWNEHSVSYVVAGGSRRRLKVYALGTIPLVETAEGDEEARPDVVGTLRSVVADAGAGKALALVGADRAKIEVLDLLLPPATDQELPDLVRNQALRDSQLLSESSVIDFIPLGADGSALRRVLAYAVPGEYVEEVKDVCRRVGIKLRRMPFAPLAAVSFVHSLLRPQETAYLLVCPGVEHVDLVAVAGSTPLFSRRAKLPSSAATESWEEALLAEIRRTLSVLPADRLPVDAVEAIYVACDPDKRRDLLEKLKAETNLAVHAFNPLHLVRSKKRELVEEPGAYVGLLGMVVTELERGQHTIDFLHPRRPPKRPSPLLVGVAAFVLTIAGLGGYGSWVYLQYQEIAAENAVLQQQLVQLDQALKKARERQQMASAIYQWVQNDINWLDELRDLATHMPSAREMLLSRISVNSVGGGQGYITFQGVARAPEIVDRMEANLRDPYRQVRTPRILASPGEDEDETRWTFDTTVTIRRRDWRSWIAQQEAAESQLTQATQPKAVQDGSNGENPVAAASDSKRMTKQRPQQAQMVPNK